MAIGMIGRDWGTMQGRDQADAGIAGIGVGDAEAFAILVDRHYGQILRYLTFRLLDPELARDLVQDVFLDAFRHFDRYDGITPFGAWLHGIAHKRLLMHWRRARLKRFVSLDWAHRSASPSLWIDADTDAIGERDALQRVLATLSPVLREALLLHSLEGFTAVEVAGILCISPAAAARRISRAKEQARERIEDISREPGSLA